MRDKALRLRWFHFCFFSPPGVCRPKPGRPKPLAALDSSLHPKKLPLAPVIVSHACDYHPSSLRRHSSTINSMRVHNLVA